MSLRHQRCRNHPAREAAARCPECGGFFCRECVTEHAGRILCAGCLSRLARGADRRPRRRLRPGRWLNAAAAFAVLWVAFHVCGQLLLRLPSRVHEGTLWEDAPWWGEEE